MQFFSFSYIYIGTSKTNIEKWYIEVHMKMKQFLDPLWYFENEIFHYSESC